AMIAIDTNLLIYAHRAALPEHAAARRAIEKASRDARGWGITLPSISEFWSVVTHPAASGGPSTSRQAQEFLHELIVEAGASLWMPREGFWKRLTDLAGRLRLAGPRVFDLQIALTAVENGAVEIWTHDGGFVSLAGLRVHDPL
ncbi:MAG: type II toxin-antitoxin system VapC family toxin, partial [Thermoanaerobaculia bacterium]